MNPTLEDIDGACERLRIRRSKLLQLVYSGELRSLKIGSRRLIPVAAIEEFVARRLKAETDSQ